MLDKCVEPDDVLFGVFDWWVAAVRGPHGVDGNVGGGGAAVDNSCDSLEISIVGDDGDVEIGVGDASGHAGDVIVKCLSWSGECVFEHGFGKDKDSVGGGDVVVSVDVGGIDISVNTECSGAA